MSYRRWGASDWYIFAHTDGGLAVWSRFAGDHQLPVYDSDKVRALLCAKLPLSTIPGWQLSSSAERDDVVVAMREYLADEAAEEYPGKAVQGIMRQVQAEGCLYDRDRLIQRRKADEASDT